MELRTFDFKRLRWVEDGEITTVDLKYYYRPLLYEWVRWSNKSCKVVAPKNMVSWE